MDKKKFNFLRRTMKKLWERIFHDEGQKEIVRAGEKKGRQNKDRIPREGFGLLGGKEP